MAVHVAFVNCIHDLSTFPSVQNCLVRCDNGTFTVVVGDFGLAEKIPDYRSVKEHCASVSRLIFSTKDKRRAPTLSSRVRRLNRGVSGVWGVHHDCETDEQYLN